MKNQQNHSIVECPIFDGAVPSELSADYILPDIFPDVKRILRVSARPMIIDRFISGRRLEFAGAVDYCILFSYEENGVEGMRAVHFNADFNSILGELDGLDSSDISISPRIGSVSAKLANPRKLTLKSSIVCDVRVCTQVSCEDTCIGDGAHSAERLTETVQTSVSRTFLTDPLKIAESFELDSGFPSAEEIVACDADIHINDIRSTSGDYMTPTLNGFVYARFVCKTEASDSDYRTFTKKLPISFNVSAEDFASAMTACNDGSITATAWAVPVEINAAIAENSVGERRTVELDMVADVGIRLLGTADTTVTVDAYVPMHGSHCEFAEHSVFAPVKVINSNFSVGESISREDLKLPDGDITVIDTGIAVRSPRLEMNASRAVLTATASVLLIGRTSDGTFFSAQTDLPVKYELGNQSISEFAVPECRLCPCDIRTRVDSEKVNFDFEIALTSEFYERRKLKTVSVITVDEPKVDGSDAAMTVCYRARGETLWDIAKRYGTTVPAIEAANKDGSRVLIIPNHTPKGIVV